MNNLFRKAFDRKHLYIDSNQVASMSLEQIFDIKPQEIGDGTIKDTIKKLNKDLMLMGLAGEGLVDKRVLIVKTHYPERYGKTKFYAERAVLLVRNPIDSITSLYNI
jgi:hypothetical protein